MLSGDMISGYNKNFLNLSLYHEVWHMLTSPMIERNIPWSITFGNHDAEGLYSGSMLVDLDRQHSAELSLSQHGSINGVGETNYILPILSSNPTDQDKVASLIYIFDSDNPGCGRLGDWGCIRPQQVEWYQQQSDLHNRVPSVAFVHVPPVEVIDLWSNFDVYGDFGDASVCCYNTSHSRFIDAMIERQDIKGLYFGHDHKNDFHGDYHGIDLGYGRKTGYGSYDPKYTQGARVILLQETPQFQLSTWIRNVYGKVEEQKLHRPQQGLKLYCCVVADTDNKYSWVIFMTVLLTIMLSMMFVVPVFWIPLSPE
ncbi:hypothetical protein SAMD00019534_010480 [Acytostelium subglobosum LB1]|uniref:hypothetical protein n=1 Tax=Acytostelium subglobosum LB1 TaxID=1410327 RepID=UPI0006449B49|nr:hypothetical protein SAMD00019534_010480 [Acytostelium subglobosum LB1]GAM17873.1 hypothetical protein SAMD00019534_010480 [Acytostelium subglobosum LB1]|eukprot:XP_012758469.1 hypothetical protein SAMD00019534_010480 [Acytostelium subglobosum LB1]